MENCKTLRQSLTESVLKQLSRCISLQGRITSRRDIAFTRLIERERDPWETANELLAELESEVAQG